MEKFIVKLIGSGVFHGEVLACIVDDTNDIGLGLEYLYVNYGIVANIDTKFVDKFGIIRYDTNRVDVKIEIELTKYVV